MLESWTEREEGSEQQMWAPVFTSRLLGARCQLPYALAHPFPDMVDRTLRAWVKISSSLVTFIGYLDTATRKITNTVSSSVSLWQLWPCHDSADSVFLFKVILMLLVFFSPLPVYDIFSYCLFFFFKEKKSSQLTKCTVQVEPEGPIFLSICPHNSLLLPLMGTSYAYQWERVPCRSLNGSASLMQYCGWFVPRKCT